MDTEAVANASGHSGEFSPVIELIIIMIIAGASGGIANFVLQQKSDVTNTTIKERVNWGTIRLCLGYMFVGIVATFLVPLFLSLVKSDLLTSIFAANGLNTRSTFEFVGFCLVGSIYSRTFIQTISDRVLAIAAKASEEAEEAKQHAATAENRADTAETTVEEMYENIPVANQEIEDKNEDDISKITPENPSNFSINISESERKILQALDLKPYQRRTLRGISKDSNLDLVETKILLDSLIKKGIVKTMNSPKTGNTLYKAHVAWLTFLKG